VAIAAISAHVATNATKTLITNLALPMPSFRRNSRTVPTLALRWSAILRVPGECKQWAFEVHPEVSFCALAKNRPMVHRKKIDDGVNERLDLLRPEFPAIDRHLENRPSGVAKDDLLDAAVAAWTALRISSGEARRVCDPEQDEKGLETTIWY
jgi:predicted RNase H-like nuclease